MITINNFRLLENASIHFEDDISLIVGKNNTGKTSFFEAIKILVEGDNDLTFEDFSQNCYSTFETVFKLYRKSIESNIGEIEKDTLEEQIISQIPKIELIITFKYERYKDSLVNLSEFITDLDDKRTDVSILLCYEPVNSIGLFSSFIKREKKEDTLILHLKKNISKFYRVKCYSIDSETNYRMKVEGNFRNKIKKVVSFENVKALRVLDDTKGDRNNTLSLGFSAYYKERDKANEAVKNLEETLGTVSETLKGKYNVVLQKILSDLRTFGANTMVTIPKITIKSEFNSEAIIKRNIKYYYKQAEIDLPESYNGLGYSNLIYMILKLASFIERCKNAKEERISEILFICIEEPEVHMHPQMQQVFISQIKTILNDAINEGVYIQLSITTHSSHIVSEAGIDQEKGFGRIRYFNRINGKVTVQDFNSLKISNEDKKFRFLRQYLSLHKADLFFADKVIIVEGTTERMLLPQMIKKVAKSLQNEYLTILEIGGAHAQIFKELLVFIRVKTLIITDIDSFDTTISSKCKVEKNKNLVSTNSTLAKWIPAKSRIDDLLECLKEDKIKDDMIKVVYQIEENGYAARSFEEAFIHTNRKLILGETMIETERKTKKHKNEFSLFKSKKEQKVRESTPYDLAPESSKAKTKFSFDIMTFPEDVYGCWEVPLYIKQGLEWLSN